jgi:SAM-dependent methyltransferase
VALTGQTWEIFIMNYKWAYSIGFHPWEDALGDPPFVETIVGLFEKEESIRQAPFGRVLDIGTGSGIWGVELAKRGWDVTGIDLIQKALDRARERVDREAVSMSLVLGDVTHLSDSDIRSDYQLILDTGTFHDFTQQQRISMGQGIDRIAAPDATILLLAWPKRLRPLIRGVNRDEIEDAFPGWEITDVEPSHFSLPKPLELLLRPDEHWYRLRRAQS